MALGSYWKELQKSSKKYDMEELLWWSSGSDSALPMQGKRIRSLVGKLRSHMLCSAAKNKYILFKKRCGRKHEGSDIISLKPVQRVIL